MPARFEPRTETPSTAQRHFKRPRHRTGRVRLSSAGVTASRDPRRRGGAGTAWGRLSLLWFVGVILAFHAGCVQRRLLIRSQPEGALVSIDRHVIGHTPVSVPYVYYGTREIQLQKDGFKTIQVKQRFRPPWYAVFPLSFFTENFWPREIYDRRVLDFELVPKDLTGDYYLLDRANQMRQDVSRGTVTAPIR